MPQLLFSEFGSSDKNAWEKQAQKELREKYDEKKIWKITPKISISPYHTATEIEEKEISIIQSCQKIKPGWLNMPLVKFDQPRLTNSKIKSVLASGADSIIFDAGENNLENLALTKTLDSIKLSDKPFFFQTKINPENLFQEISRNAGYYLKGGFFNDPIANWMREGGEFEDQVESIKSVFEKTKMMSDFRPFVIESRVYHDAGANVVQELGFLIASTIHYLDLLTDLGISAESVLNRCFYTVSIGTDYLTEIAKLRALRVLNQKIRQAYQVSGHKSGMFIHAKTSSFYDSASSAETNMLRATTEAMSAVVGGCDGLTVQPYNHSFASTNDFSERMARNVPLLLAHESYFDRVSDPAAGSYQIEKMTVSLVNAAWDLFLQTEEKGGLVKCFGDGFIQSEIEKSWQNKLAELDNGKLMVGVNKYKNEEDLPFWGKKSDSKILPENPLLLPGRNLSQTFLEK